MEAVVLTILGTAGDLPFHFAPTISGFECMRRRSSKRSITESTKGGPMKKDPEDAPEDFLKSLGESLKQTEGVDVGLADIIKTHILVAAPPQNAVEQARAAILKLAGERASSSIQESADG